MCIRDRIQGVQNGCGLGEIGQPSGCEVPVSVRCRPHNGYPQYASQCTSARSRTQCTGTYCQWDSDSTICLSSSSYSAPACTQRVPRFQWVMSKDRHKPGISGGRLLIGKQSRSTSPAQMHLERA
eukprot:TRINITY_DN12983_c0_g1_i1.p1 TRINITY_DN12983_c0_g1~~TRINITY_DN12983_c0_g1_i1.p1  ORF type:complete len:125 (-),score=11.13 TRINITY_DN12983_c0_g1_i1:128-502(-)